MYFINECIMPKCLQIMCAKYYELWCMFYKNKLHSSKLEHLLDTSSKFVLFSVSGLKDKKLIKKEQTYTKTETCKLYSRVFWIFLSNFIKIDLYNFELYRFKVGAFFSDTVYIAEQQYLWTSNSLSDNYEVTISNFINF